MKIVLFQHVDGDIIEKDRIETEDYYSYSCRHRGPKIQTVSFIAPGVIHIYLERDDKEKGKKK